MSKQEMHFGSPNEGAKLRRGWTTGACAAAALKAALTALLTGKFVDPVSITLPKGEQPEFALALSELTETTARAGIIKDAGDDPDVTHGALIITEVKFGPKGSGIVFKAGKGVGTVTKPGLPIAVGEAAINPVPRQMMTEIAENLCDRYKRLADLVVTISVPGGEKLAARTWNPRLGIVGGISILGTTGIVHPFSCSAWIHSIRSGIDVCRATGITHALGATGSTSEALASSLYDFADEAILDMGDFVGGLLKYLRDHPLPKLTLAGGFGKFSKLAKGAMDLHSGRSQVDFIWLADETGKAGFDTAVCKKIATANTAFEVLELCGDPLKLANHIAMLARQKAENVLREAPVDVEVLIVSREGRLIGRCGKHG